jgi:hypothetical protein
VRNGRPADQAGTAAARAAAGEARHVEDVGVLGMEHEEREAGGGGSQAGLLLLMRTKRAATLMSWNRRWPVGWRIDCVSNPGR